MGLGRLGIASAGAHAGGAVRGGGTPTAGIRTSRERHVGARARPCTAAICGNAPSATAHGLVIKDRRAGGRDVGAPKSIKCQSGIEA